MNLHQTYTGGSVFYPDYLEGPHRLVVAAVCGVADQTAPIHALLDTGGEWCVLPVRIAQELGIDLEPDGVTPPLHSRFGLIDGRLERLPISFFAIEGGTIDIDATCFVSRDWPGPMVVGWKGCLERIRFGMDPSEDVCYFASL